MASKLALTAILLAALVALASATTYTTTVTTITTDDETNPREQQQCQRQIQGRQFRSCQRYFSQGSGSQYELIEMNTENPREEQQSLQQCCEQLRNVSENCRCEAIRQAVRQQQKQGGSYEGQGQQMQQMYERARNLPRQCGFRQPQQCQIRAIFV